LDSSETVFDLRPIRMLDLFHQVSEEYQLRTAAKQQRLRSIIHDAVPTLIGDFARLRQVLTELLDNALAYTPPGGTISLEIAAPIKEERQWVTITVQDTGPGISAEDQSRIFERFFRGKVAEQGNITGTGLGLCITQQIVQAHRGYVEVQTELGVGTSFTVWLPTGIFCDRLALP
jgi:signal transduction histidine kinase